MNATEGPAPEDPTDDQLAAVLNDLERHYRETNNPTDLLHAAALSYTLGRPVPAWAHVEIAKVAVRFYETDGELDLNQALGGKGKERKRSRFARMRRNSKKVDLAILIGNALAANAALSRRRRRSKSAIWQQLAIDTGLAMNTLRNEWGKELRRVYELYRNDPEIFPPLLKVRRNS